MVLIQNILDGNQTAQEILYKRYRRIIKDFILSKHKTYYDIDDDVSEILIKIFMNIDDFSNQKSKFKSWVLTITKNYLIDKWRCKSSHNSIILPPNSKDNLTVQDFYHESYFNAVQSNTGIENLNLFEDSNAVEFISKQISINDYTMLNMKYVQGYDYNEIGREFQLTSSTVSNKINYIKVKIKKNFSEDIFE